MNSDPRIDTFQNDLSQEFRYIAVNGKFEEKTNAASTALLINSTLPPSIPSSGLYGYEKSAYFKATLNEFVVQIDARIFHYQKHVNNYTATSIPDSKSITGYDLGEVQNCFAVSLAIESWRQMFFGQPRTSPTLSVDSYFTDYPANFTILLRRSVNGQPALLIYEHGFIIISMFFDWVYRSQTSSDRLVVRA